MRRHAEHKNRNTGLHIFRVMALLNGESKQPSVVILLKTKLGYMHLERGETSVFT